MGMTNESTDPNETEEKFVDFVQRNAQDYNASGGDVPREAMWTAITAARAEARRAKAARRRTIWVTAGMAATLAIGVALGRMGRPEATPEASLASSADAGATGTGGAGSAAGNATYDKATATHLVGAEAMLMSFTSATPRNLADTSVTRWAKDLLVNTRLLLDSPAAADASRRRLLQDLERVLVQIVQQSPAESDADVRAHVERSMDRTHMIMRLRALQGSAINGES
jgi:hypothetical protein